MNPLEFLAVMAETANKHDFQAHMNLISKEVSVYGVPGFEVITYDDWYKQCEHEFDNKLLKKVSYDGLNVLAETPDRVMFKSVETVEGSDGRPDHGPRSRRCRRASLRRYADQSNRLRCRSGGSASAACRRWRASAPADS